MEKYSFILFICLLPLSLFAQTRLTSFGQDCGGYYYLTNHAEIQMTTCGGNGTPNVVVTSHISKYIKKKVVIVLPRWIIRSANEK